MNHLLTFVSRILSLIGCHVCFAGASKLTYLASVDNEEIKQATAVHISLHV